MLDDGFEMILKCLGITVLMVVMITLFIFSIIDKIEKPSIDINEIQEIKEVDGGYYITINNEIYYKE